MRSNSSIQLSKAWWKKEQPPGLSKSAAAFEKELDEYSKLSAGLKSGADASAVRKVGQVLDAIESAAKQVISEAVALEKKAKSAEEKKDLKNTIDVMGKPLQKELAAARSKLDDLEDDEDEEDTGSFGEIGAHSTYVKKFAGKLKKAPYSFALGVPSNDPAEMRFAFHRKKGGRALGGILKKAAGCRKFTFGIASSEALGGEDDEGSNRTLLLNLQGRRIPGLAKRVKVLLRALNVSAFGKVKLLIGGVEVESADENTDEAFDPLDLTGDDDESEEETSTEIPAAPPPPPEPAERIQKALAGLIKRIVAIGAPLAQQLGADAKQIQALLREGQLQDAALAVRTLAEAVAAAEQQGAGTGGGEQAGPDPLALWRDAKEAADGGIAALQNALRSRGHPDLMRIAEYGLNGATEGNQVAMMKALMEYKSASGTTKADAAARLSAQAAQYRAFLNGNALIALCEQNPFGVAVDIRGTLGRALDEIERAVSA